MSSCEASLGLQRRTKDQILADAPDPDVEVISDEERAKLEEFGRGLADVNMVVNTMRGVKRGIVIRAFEAHTRQLESGRYPAT